MMRLKFSAVHSNGFIIQECFMFLRHYGHFVLLPFRTVYLFGHLVPLLTKSLITVMVTLYLRFALGLIKYVYSKLLHFHIITHVVFYYIARNAIILLHFVRLFSTDYNCCHFLFICYILVFF